MADWLSYALSDFLPFSLETYRRLGVLYNQRFSVVLPVGVGIGLIALLLLWRPTSQRLRLALVGLGLSWLWISWAFQLQTLAPLLWAGELAAIAFALQGGLLLAGAVFLPLIETPSIALLSRPALSVQRPLSDWAAFAMLTFAVLLQPMLELGAGRAWTGLSLFGTAATPTAIGTLAVVSILDIRLALLLMPIPLLWCLIAGLLLFGLGDPLWLVPGGAILVALVAFWLSWRSERSA